jgi:anti-sigma factor RsiW
MCCDSFAEQILTYEANLLPAPERETVERHLALCPECRNFFEQLRALDSTLARGVNVPALSPQFSERLRQRIQEQGALPLQASVVAERRRQLEIEYEAGLARLRHSGFRMNPLLAGLGYATLVALAAWLLNQYALPALAASFDMLGSVTTGPFTSFPTALGVSLLLVVTVLLFPQTRRWAGVR